MKKISKISSSFIAFLAVLILLVSTTSGFVSAKETTAYQTTKASKNSEKSEADHQHYFNKATIEAVFSQLIKSYDYDSVTFLISDFKFVKLETFSNYLNIFNRELHLEILFEHLAGPNAP
ncbi:MAG: hypothetical protein V4683_04525 [Bacteroidota bacterium]